MIINFHNRNIEIDDELVKKYEKEYCESLNEKVINCYLNATYHNNIDYSQLSKNEIKLCVEKCINLEVGN